MKGKKIDEVITALRCSAHPYPASCEGCSYRVLEEVDERIPLPANVEQDGKKYWESCDCDQIVLDAAELLEQLKPAEHKEATYCSCWCEWPNVNHKKENGSWKCVDRYECERQKDGNRKTKCRLKEKE